MQSPLPGMDPYIEACGLWEDFHGHLIERIGEALAGAVPDRYLVRTGERSYLVLVGQEGKERTPFFLPDVSLTAPPSAGPSPARPGPAVAEHPVRTPPIPMRAFIEEEYRETFVEIYEAGRGNRLITSIEVLSPSNKRPSTPGWDLYQRKRQALLLGEANLVEIDLLRGGQRMPMLDPWPDSPYSFLVSRLGRVPRCLVWPVSYRQPLDELPVPLARPDPDIVLSLQPMIDSIYARYRYHRTIDYSRPLDPPLPAADAAWLEERVRAGAASAKRRPARRRPRGG